MKSVNPPAIPNRLLKLLDEKGILQPRSGKGIKANRKKTAAKTAKNKSFFPETSLPENNRGNGTKASAIGLTATLIASKNALSLILPLVTTKNEYMQRSAAKLSIWPQAAVVRIINGLKSKKSQAASAFFLSECNLSTIFLTK